MIRALGHRPIEVLAADDYLAVFDSEATIRAITPNYALLGQLDLRGVIVTAPGTDVDFVSRFFAPKYGVPKTPSQAPLTASLRRTGPINLARTP